MKKVLFMSAMLFAGIAMASPVSTTTLNATTKMEIQQEKVKIETDALPDPIKASIAANEEVKALVIAEAFKVSKVDGTTHFEVVFDNGTEEKLTKKYDEEGNEIKD
ncbi:hypothetical protein [Algoriphagus yeomjeoni]|uniref:PepSY domain-containing protein n=1 Tax=Algoriphagus yeomjeoni TaxID=291403 RepID=A0A327P3Q4_9BACT|nr:hypothetical protein [Algoriphagus yeomjeoni]RAI86017.1 hypothetical protein LV83_03461 [Algoriphagus yeomjeoni]